MRPWITVTFFIALLALCFYGVVGETGPIGWLNGMQATNTGSYSRVLSLFILLAAVGVIAVGLLALWIVVRDKFLGGPPAPRPSPVAPGTLPAIARPLPFWRTSFIVLFALVALVWAGVLGWHAWDWQRRASDAGSDYAPVRLTRDATPAAASGGSHLKLQGRLLWEHSLVRHTDTHNGTVEPDVVFLPVVGADWRAGDPVHFVVQVDRTRTFPLEHRPGGADAPLWVRVDGAVPGATRPVFGQGGSPLSDSAMLVEVVDPEGGQPADAHPVFDWHSAGEIGGWLSAFMALLWLTAVTTFQLKAWKQRRSRRGGRAAA